MNEIDQAIRLRALLGGLSACGDLGEVYLHDGMGLAWLLDVLGHGVEARQVALKAQAYLMDQAYLIDPSTDLKDLLTGLHQELSGTRGAVVDFCLIDLETGNFSYSGIGNISSRIIGKTNQRLVSRDGIVGYGTIRPHVTTGQLRPGDILIIHSDGLSDHWDSLALASRKHETAAGIADFLMDQFANKQDDASCIVLKFGHS